MDACSSSDIANLSRSLVSQVDAFVGRRVHRGWGPESRYRASNIAAAANYDHRDLINHARHVAKAIDDGTMAFLPDVFALQHYSASARCLS